MHALCAYKYFSLYHVSLTGSPLVGLHATFTNSLQSAQNATAKMITDKRKFDHTIPEHMNCHWFPVKERITIKILLLTFKFILELTPEYLCNLIKLHKPTCLLRSPNLVFSGIPRSEQVTYEARAFSYLSQYYRMNCHSTLNL